MPDRSNQIHAKAETVKRQYFASAALLLPLLSLSLAPNQLGLAVTLLRANAAAIKLSGDQEEAALWLASSARALVRAPHPLHAWMLPGVMNDAGNRLAGLHATMSRFCDNCAALCHLAVTKRHCIFFRVFQPVFMLMSW
jgi:hypothetical protein